MGKDGYIINAPVLVKKLFVYPQAERMCGTSPSKKYLHLLNSLSPTENKIYDYVYFSRGAYYKGGIAGERYLEQMLSKIGVLVIRPETLELKEQLRLIKQAKTLIIAEGSAVHLLQLLGNVLEHVIILSRRKRKEQFCKNIIKSRANTVDYINVIDHTLVQDYLSAGITIIKADLLLAKLKFFGVNLSRVWNNDDYNHNQNQDIIEWKKFYNITNS